MTDPDAIIRRREAAAWAVRLDAPECSQSDRLAFEQWCTEPPNEAAWGQLQSALKGVDALRSDPDILSLRHQVRKRQTWPTRASLRAPARSGRTIGALVVAASLVAVVGLWWDMNPPVRIYDTKVGEPQRIELADGSRVELDADSRLSVQYRRGARALVLERGQALFTVESDAERPFTVAVAGGSVTAVGTVFDVQRLGTGARVILVEGVVRVAQSQGRHSRDWTLQAGQSVMVGGGDAGPVSNDAVAATRWVEGLRVFERTPVSDAVEALNRHGRERIVLVGTGWGGMKISGSFRVDDTRGFAMALAKIYPIDVTDEADGTLHLDRNSPDGEGAPSK